jgi:hypothetical protein
VASTSSRKIVRKLVGVALLLACLPLDTTASLPLTIAITLTTIGLILIFFG